MSELIVIGFKDTWRAGQVLAELQRMDVDWIVDLEDAITVVKRKDGRLRIQQSYNLTEKAAGWGGFVGISHWGASGRSSYRGNE